MNIQRKNSAHHFRMQSECEQTLSMGLEASFTKSNLLMKAIILDEPTCILKMEAMFQYLKHLCEICQ